MAGRPRCPFSCPRCLSCHVSGGRQLPRRSARAGPMALGALTRLFPPPPQLEARNVGPAGPGDRHRLPRRQHAKGFAEDAVACAGSVKSLSRFARRIKGKTLFLAARGSSWEAWSWPAAVAFPSSVSRPRFPSALHCTCRPGEALGPSVRQARPLTCDRLSGWALWTSPLWASRRFRLPPFQIRSLSKGL